jgi:peptidoglycan/LPS O-acetylase OafA/YrhL
MYWHGALWRGWPAVAASSGWIGKVPLFFAQVGFLGVNLFLVLSGFCLYYPVVARGRAHAPYPGFLRARILRIWPPYLASLALLWIGVSLGGAFRYLSFTPVAGWDVAIHAFFLHNLHNRTIWSINGAYWSLALEWQLYLVFPITLAVLRRWKVAGLFLGTALLALLFPLTVQKAVGTSSLFEGWWSVVFNSMPARLFEFSAGVVVAELAVQKRLPRRLWLALGALVWLPVVYLVQVSKVLPPPLDNLACGLSFASLVGLVVSMPTSKPSILLKFAAWVGGISYSLYLVHQPLLLVMRPTIYKLALRDNVLWLVATTLAVPGLIGCAYVFHRAFERPFLRGQRLRTWIDSIASKPVPVNHGEINRPSNHP